MRAFAFCRFAPDSRLNARSLCCSPGRFSRWSAACSSPLRPAPPRRRAARRGRRRERPLGDPRRRPTPRFATLRLVEGRPYVGIRLLAEDPRAALPPRWRRDDALTLPLGDGPDEAVLAARIEAATGLAVTFTGPRPAAGREREGGGGVPASPDPTASRRRAASGPARSTPCSMPGAPGPATPGATTRRGAPSRSSARAPPSSASMRSPGSRPTPRRPAARAARAATAAPTPPARRSPPRARTTPGPNSRPS